MTSAQQLVSNYSELKPRVLLMGASGWFGTTVIELLQKSSIQFLAIGSQNRNIFINGLSIPITTWDKAIVRNFKPTLVVDCAFLTRDKISNYSLDEYRRLNQELLDRFYWSSALDTVNSLVGLSSGAAVFPVDALTRNYSDNPYGYLKREFELEANSRCSGKPISIIRPWSVSGPNVQRPSEYAFSDLIIQASTGSIKIHARSEIFRRFVSVHDLMALGLSAGFDGHSTLIESGGDLIEIEDLAKLIAKTLKLSVKILRERNPKQTPDVYFSDNKSWSEHIELFGLKPLTLEEQIIEVGRNSVAWTSN